MWASRAALAVDLSGLGEPVSADRVHKWAQSGAIPAVYHGRILRAAAARGYQLTADDLVRAHDIRGEDAA